MQPNLNDPQPRRESLREREMAQEQMVRQEAVVEGINRVLREALICRTEEAVARVCLVVAEELTKSEFGFIGELNAAGRFDTLAQSEGVADLCRVPGADAQAAIKDSEILGLWGLALKTGQAVIANNPALHPERVGLPEGHPPLRCFLGVPLKEAGRTVGLLGLANKKSGYHLEDQQAVATLCVAFWEALSRKRAEEALRRERDFIRQMLETSPAGIVLLDSRGQITLANARAEKVLGLARDGIASRTYNAAEWQITDYEGHPFADEDLPFRRVIATGRPVQNVRHAIHKPEGQRVLLSINAAPLLDVNGQVSAVVATVEDETQRVQAERALRESQRLLERDITERQRAEEQLLVYQQQLRSLASELSAAEQRERRRIATLLHDEVLQTLALAKIKLGEAVAAPDLAASLNATRKLLEQTIEQIRSLTLQLSPPILHELGLEAALDWLADQIVRPHGVRCRFEDDGQPKPLDEDVKSLLFSAVRELLFNLVKHAQASQATIRVQREQDAIRIAVEDDGRGFAASQEPGKGGGFGLFHIRERLGYLGGRCEVQSTPGHGTRVALVAPLKKASG